MSDNDTTEDTNVTEETVEFAQSHFDEDAVDTTTPTDADAPAEPAKEEAETPETDADKAEESTEEKPAEGDDKPDEATTEEKSDSDLKGMSRAERAAYFQSLKQESTREVAEVVNQNYAPQEVTALQEAYMNQGYDEGTSLMLARQDVSDQKAQIAEATAEIAELNANLRVDSFEAQSRYDWMNPNKTDSYQQELHESAAEIFSQGIVTDPRTQQIVDARMTPGKSAELVDKIWNAGIARGQEMARKAASAEIAAVAPPTSSAPPSSSGSVDDKQASGLERALGNIR